MFTVVYLVLENCKLFLHDGCDQYVFRLNQNLKYVSNDIKTSIVYYLIQCSKSSEYLLFSKHIMHLIYKRGQKHALAFIDTQWTQDYRYRFSANLCKILHQYSSLEYSFAEEKPAFIWKSGSKYTSCATFNWIFLAMYALPPVVKIV